MPEGLTVRPVLRVKAAEDLVLPIVDVTNPAFALSLTTDELAAMEAQYVRESPQSQNVSPEMRAALASSRLGSGLMAARGTFLSGLNTYLLKLGPENLPADFHPIDRRIAGSFPATTARLRLQDMAALLTDGLADALASDPRRPLHFINIAGGPGADSWNTLIRLRGIDEALADREITVSVLDLDDQGPDFGGRALEALQSEGAPLDGLHVHFHRRRYDWSESAELRDLLGPFDLRAPLCAVSSEGGLFEYGSDEEIAANLSVLREMTPDDTIVAGSACRESESTRAHAGIGVTLRPRTREAFQQLVEGSGWRVDALIERPFNDNLRLKRGTA